MTTTNAETRRAVLPRFVPRKWAAPTFGFLLSGLMSLLLSGLVTYFNSGFAPGFGGRWIGGFLRTWPVSFPVVLVLAPLVRRFVDAITRED